MPNLPFRYVISSKHLKKELIELNPILANSEQAKFKSWFIKRFFKSIINHQKFFILGDIQEWTLEIFYSHVVFSHPN